MTTVYFVVPCYNEEEVLPETIKRLDIKLQELIKSGKATEQSRMLFVDDGSKDKTWEIIEQKLSRLSSMNPVERRVQRLLLGHASECQMDGAGRLLIAPVLRQHAGLTKEVMLVGQFNKFELWDETTWHQQVKEDIDAEQLATGDLSERLQDLSL